MPFNLKSDGVQKLQLGHAADYGVRQDGREGSVGKDVAEEDLENHGYALLEVDNVLLAAIERGKNESTRPALVIRGRPNDAAVLCTETETYAIRRVDWSNTLLLAEHPQQDTAEMDTGIGTEASAQSSTAQIHASLAHLLEARRIQPNTSRLRDVMTQANAIWDGFSPVQTTPGVAMDELQRQVQASQRELLEGLTAHDIVALEDGAFRMLASEYVCHALASIFTAFAAESVTLTEGSSVSPRMCFTAMDLGDSDAANAMDVDIPGSQMDERVPATVIRHCFRRFAEPHRQKVVDMAPYTHAHASVSAPVDDQLYAFSEHKVCRYLGHEIFRRSQETRYRRDDFMQAWADSVPEGYTVSLDMLAGICIAEEESTSAAGVGDGSARPLLLRYLPADLLARDPAVRMRALFDAQPRWSAEALRVYLKELATTNEEIDGWLMKTVNTQ
ncbi:sister chromatid cohesion protein Dcc1 [Thamnocephalis sphaerospora]|uniref:Sister chromatid cohesion protein Dcc1 n=1 Tax=Thamnocephalis sphaerospora TaxID=78915 RepID=A0A4P9XXX2_9FUNG|nr:sister chromatid cohesion protein Dcc1 [Thamnocephalis sphaerospora]|eukprot:RKP10270.1 sister chromatid cohesion protein Dcc1 [Thamnocephalis sphaerospora]